MLAQENVIEVVKFVVEEGNARLRELIDWGINFDKNEEEFHLTKEGGHSEKRIVHNKDRTDCQFKNLLFAK